MFLMDLTKIVVYVDVPMYQSLLTKQKLGVAVGAIGLLGRTERTKLKKELKKRCSNKKL